MMKVAVIALLAAPTALAFTADNLRGVWSCVVDAGIKMTMKQGVLKTGVLSAAVGKVTLPATWTESDETSRVVVFDDPRNSKVARLFQGRTYYTHGVDTEEHEFRGFLTSGIDGEFFLAENYWNAECEPPAGFSVMAGALPTAASTTDNAMPPTIASGAYHGKGSCRDRPEGPWKFTIDDADHFTLTVDPTDLQLDNYLEAGGASTNSGVARIHSIEKCMRGLPEKSEMCAHLSRSGITTSSEKDNACQGTLVCHAESTSEPWGCEEECCTQRPRVVPTYAPQPYYYPQPNYFQQPYTQFSPFQSNPFNIQTQPYGR